MSPIRWTLWLYPGVGLTIEMEREQREGLWMFPWNCAWNDLIWWIKSRAANTSATDQGQT